jgi:hypothetical protein
MQTRHRVPTIFNLSMVDVLCCALGCVILLWLLNLREAKERAAKVGETSAQLLATQSSLDEATSLLLLTSGERDQLRDELQAARARQARLDKDLAGLRAQGVAAAERLAHLSREQQTLTEEKTAAAQRLVTLRSQLQNKEKLAQASAQQIDALMDRLDEAEAKISRLQTLANQVPGLKADLQESRSKLADVTARAETLEADRDRRQSDLSDADRNIEQLQREKRTLTAEVNRVRVAAENRFEGIALTGRRVVFLVDMSGSMELVDERTPDAHKWEGVRQTLAKVMRSLPDLEKFQIIVFSEKATYLLGSEGRWLDFDPKTTVSQVVHKLEATKPVGGTDMHTALEAAFRLRPDGLDTIYVFSDGLPNMGPGLTPEQASSLNEDQRSDVLARYIRNLLRTNWNRPFAGRPRVRINTIGFFYESPDVGAFLWALARENDGSFVGMSKP